MGKQNPVQTARDFWKSNGVGKSASIGDAVTAASAVKPRINAGKDAGVDFAQPLPPAVTPNAPKVTPVPVYRPKPWDGEIE